MTARFRERAGVLTLPIDLRPEKRAGTSCRVDGPVSHGPGVAMLGTRMRT